MHARRSAPAHTELQIRYGGTMKILNKAPAHEVRDSRGVTRIYRPQPDVLVSVVAGHFAHAGALRIIQTLDLIGLEHTQLRQWHHWYDMSSFDITSQRDLTTWHVRHRKLIHELNIVCRSQLVLMGVRVANVALGGLIQVYQDPAMFEAAIDRELL